MWPRRLAHSTSFIFYNNRDDLFWRHTQTNFVYLGVYPTLLQCIMLLIGSCVRGLNSQCHFSSVQGLLFQCTMNVLYTLCRISLFTDWLTSQVFLFITWNHFYQWIRYTQLGDHWGEWDLCRLNIELPCTVYRNLPLTNILEYSTDRYDVLGNRYFVTYILFTWSGCGVHEN